MHEPFHIDRWLIEPHLNRILDGDIVFQIEPRVMQTLLCLAEHAGEVVSRGEIVDTVWTDAVVEENSLTNAVSDLRKVFGDDPRDPMVIETIRSVGYRLVAPVGPSRSSRRVRRHVAIGVASAAAVVTVGVVGMILTRGETSPTEPQPPQTTWSAVPLTSYPGIEYHPAISPDGEFVAFSWNRDDGEGSQLFVKQIGTESPTPLTRGPAVHVNPAWSPDGTELAYIRTHLNGGRDDCSIMLSSALGGDARRLTDCRRYSNSSLSWSPDGRWIAYSDQLSSRDPFQIFLISTDSHERWKLTRPASKQEADLYPAFSPDGQTLAFVRGALGSEFNTSASAVRGAIYLAAMPELAEPGQASLVSIRSHSAVDATDLRRLTDEEAEIHGLDWLPDGNGLVFSTYGLFQVSLHDGSVRPMMSTRSAYLRNPVAARIRDRLVYERWEGDANIFRISGGTDEPIIQSTRWDFSASYNPDGSRLAFVSRRSGPAEIWLSDADGEQPTQLTTLGSFETGFPRWSPDGASIVFETRVGEDTDLYLIRATGGSPANLTEGPFDDRAPSWSIDGETVYFGSNRSGDWQIWSLAPGSEPEPVTAHGGFSAREVEVDGRRSIVYTRLDTTGIWQKPRPDGDETMFEPGLSGFDWASWDVTGGSLFWIERDARQAHVMRRELGAATGSRFVSIDRMVWGGMPSIAISPNGGAILYTALGRRSSDLIMVEGPF